jgi:thiol-disulfide isomerase/thioredoxin
MLRFLTFVAFIGILHSIYRINAGPGGIFGEKDAVAADSGRTRVSDSPVSVATSTTTVPSAQRPTLYLFTGRGWCAACRSLDAKVLVTPEWKSLTLHQVNYKEIVLPQDFSKASNPGRDLASKYRIQSVPTLLVVSPSGAEMGRRPGVGANASKYVSWVREISGIPE